MTHQMKAFDPSKMGNVRYARPDATDDEMCRACRLAHADEFIRALPQGYERLIGENGNRLSGVERHRLSIARAILRDAPIVLLDEATASLDIENELAVKEARSPTSCPRRRRSSRSPTCCPLCATPTASWS